jgi:hypothetical protein
MVEVFEQQFKIPASQMLVFKKSYMGMSFACEHINDPKNLEYTLINARVYEGSSLYIEKAGENKPK